MPSASLLAESISCPGRFLEELNRTRGNHPPPRFTEQRGPEDNLSHIVAGRGFEGSIQHLMTSSVAHREEIELALRGWFRDLLSDATPRSLNEVDEPWDETWIEDDDVRETRLSRMDWYGLGNAFRDWTRSEMPWQGEEVEWQREKNVQGKVSLFDGSEEIEVWGRIDLYGRSESKEYIVELKHTKQTSIRKARAQASLYQKVLHSKDSPVLAYVYHHKEHIKDPLEEDDWAELHRRGVDGELSPTRFNCSLCPARNCIDRFSDGRSFGY